MNEVELIRAQLLAERQHATEVANACAAALESAGGQGVTSGSELDGFRQACVDYLVWVLAQFEERDQMLSDLFHARRNGGDVPTHDALNEIIARRGTSREALTKLEAALVSNPTRATGDAPADSWRAFAQFFNGAWSTRRNALDELFERKATVADWRVVSGIDADSILEERNRYQRVRAKLPAGIELHAPIVKGT